ncbi:MAG: MoaD/ThiS family protein [Candidatus Heimdallarchaeota archaeon]
MSNNKIKVTVKFFAMLREFGPKEENIVIAKDSPIKLLFKKYQIPKEAWKAIILVNGLPHNDQNTILKDGDIVSIFPPIGGG